MDLSGHFEKVYAEYEGGREKPNTYMGLEAIEYLGADKDSRLVLVGDSAVDVEFANNLKELGYDGVVNVLLNRDGKPVRCDSKPDIVIPSLEEILRIWN